MTPLHQAEYLAGDMSAADYIATLEAELARARDAYGLAAVSARGAIRMAAEVAAELEDLRASAGNGHRGPGTGRPVRGGLNDAAIARQ